MKTKPHFNPSKVLLDTNFLLLPFQRRIDVFTEIPRLLGGHVVFLVLPQIMAELKWLTSEGSTKEQTIARNAMKLITQCCEVVEDLS
ncbi:MAG: hypothetical protein ACFFD8_02440, partial [Candidatus Thorarchaeota archaeon]